MTMAAQKKKWLSETLRAVLCSEHARLHLNLDTMLTGAPAPPGLSPLPISSFVLQEFRGLAGDSVTWPAVSDLCTLFPPHA